MGTHRRGQASAAGQISDTDTDLTFGFGVAYDFSPRVAARLQFQDYDDFSVISVGVVYKF